VCGGNSPFIDVLDFNKNCEDLINEKFPVSGVPIYYAMCEFCNFVFAPEFWGWDNEQFKKRIYNSEYIFVDPDFLTQRPTRQAEQLNSIFGRSKKFIRHLDYGGGNGETTNQLVSYGWDSTTYDPYNDQNSKKINELGKFNLITAFEVFEHVANPNELMKNITFLLDENEAMVFFSTGLSNGKIMRNKRLDWWYVAPRNGHISIYSLESLSLLAKKNNLNFASLGESIQCLWRKFPDWAEGLVKN